MNKVTVLFLSADPTDAARLRLGEEFREIQEKLRLSKERERFDLHIRTAVRPQDITQALLDIEPHIVHFSGHGTSHGEICVEDAFGHINPISPNALQLLFKQFSEQVKLVILNACYSAVQAQAISAHIKYVIGMQKSIGDRAAIAFSVGFYQAIGAGKSVSEAFDLGRVQISLQGIPENLTPVLISTLSRNVDGLQSGDEPYRIFLGKKLRSLRNVHLRLSKKRMADFLGLETVSELEAYERGEKELPRRDIEDIEDFFFLRKEFFESVGVAPFRTLYVYDKEVGVLLDQGFRVLFLCKPKPRDGLYTFPVLWKIERDYVRVISTNLSSFHENGRGKFNVEHLILLMLERGISDTETACITTSNQNWKLLEESAFYFSKISNLGISRPIAE